MRRWVNNESWLPFTSVGRTRVSSSVGRHMAPSALHDAVVHSLLREKIKGRSVFSVRHQPLLDEMYRYVEEIEAARKHIKDAANDNVSPESKREGTLKETKSLSDEEIESLALKHGLKKIKRPLIFRKGIPASVDSFIPLKPSVSANTEVRAHIEQRRSAGQNDAAPLCVCEDDVDEKYVQLLHTTAVATQMIRGVLRKNNSDDVARQRYRPLGFCISFRGVEKYPILTVVALQMAFAIMDCRQFARDSSSGMHYNYFSRELLDKCDLSNDQGNFERIIAAIRTVLKWDGPMFIAIENFTWEFEGPNMSTIFETVCRALLDKSPLLPTTVSQKGPVIYERYLAVSSSPFDAASLVEKTNRHMIMQPTAVIELKDIFTALVNNGSNRPAKFLNHYYQKLFVSGRVDLTNMQLLFLIHLALNTGNQSHLAWCFSDTNSRCYGFSSESVFWLNRFGRMLLMKKSFTEDMCVGTCELVVGLCAQNMFDVVNSDCPAFAFAKQLPKDVVVVQGSPIRVLVTPQFIELAMISEWPELGTRRFISNHAGHLFRTFKEHISLALTLNGISEQLIEFRPSELCQRLVQRWIGTTAAILGGLTFRALCLRFACALCDGMTGSQLLSDVCSSVNSDGGVVFDVQFASGPLVVVERVANFPSMFMDAFRCCDDERHNIAVEKERQALLEELRQTELDNYQRARLDKAIHDLVPSAPSQQHADRVEMRQSSYELIQEALAKGDHFSFQSNNPTPRHRGDDGVIFLRETSDERAWVVFLIETEQSSYGSVHRAHKQRKKPSAKEARNKLRHWRDNVGPLPGDIADANGKVHKLRYVRILVTADRIEHETLHCTDIKKRYDDAARLHKDHRELLTMANASYIHLLQSSERAAIEDDVGKWARSHQVPCEDDSAPVVDDLTRAAKLVAAVGAHGSCAATEMRSGPVIAECFMDLDTIKRWCPTVSVFAGNFVKIREVAGAVRA
ncbi:multi-copy leucine-rich repeat protein, putative [Bodo saltans]|uniref:Multi-copy leucine-rich repeat protein, putative n=1 Tax=Bodo saltans TaxID=75058 RepID=A0A0S4JE06_BODSA|nr:multi-copy leucine-rich repeat protein, putative [Bodo saltans]|eukprot:CUG88209.1 multi-copy leucine-rich repeat protein, putative [Bodo saltans]